MDPTRPTPHLLAAAALLLALSPSAYASPVDSAWDAASGRGDRAVVCMRDGCIGDEPESCDRLAFGSLCGIRGSLDAWCDGDCGVGDPTMDRDHDHVSDEAEELVCGRRGYEAVQAHAETVATRCDSPDDLAGLADRERDGLPDDLEPALCGVEDRTSDLDGSCDPSATDYTL